MLFQRNEDINWIEFRRLPNYREVDFHWVTNESDDDYLQAIEDVRRLAIRALQKAQSEGVSYLLLLHESPMSEGLRRTTARSTIRKLMRSRNATPYILRSQCVQHHTCFVAAIRPRAAIVAQGPEIHAVIYRRGKSW